MGHKRIDKLLEPAARALSARLLPFYRRYPYRGRCSLFKVDPRGAYSPADGFFYSRVPKAANTTVTSALAERSTYRRRFAKAGDVKDAYLRPSYLSARSVRALEAGVKFTFVRDPYTRTLSAFSDKILGRRPQARPFTEWFGDWPDDAPPGFADFCRFLDAGGLTLDPHWAPQTDILLLPVAAFDFIGRTERLEEDLAEVLTRIFGPTDARAIESRGRRTGASDRVAQAYTPEALDIVNRLYARDFRELDYPVRQTLPATAT
ncbi:hypothetical protein Ga0609869_002612 [Rhodovulum iodosum]|uniref:Sulfotransferase family protein n=1 Tax=Rhodovulum iodosum TaxID=68291 RepID=A0ABV3XW48_9RHOB|nr:sulfotransferase family protein [Rhodovulum robiginosum]RSK33557.1 sulfotransferase family protein [Rhodovulum robiginosum]